MNQVSKNPITGKEYQIPESLNDKETIDKFTEQHQDKPFVVVQGLGFVGAAMSLVVANGFKDYAVIGVDLPNAMSYWKIRSINEGDFPIVAEDPMILEFYEATREKKNFLATYDAYAYSKADVIVVDINLDVQKEAQENNYLTGFDVDLTGFKKAIASIGKHCKEDALLLVETTVPVGTCEKVVYPIIQQEFEARNLSVENFKIGHSYERVMPGKNYINSIRNFYRVYSGINEKSAIATRAFLETIIQTNEYPLTQLGNTNSTEIAKVLENSFRAMNISFMAEWSRLAEESGANIYEIVRAIRMRPTHKNIMLPGLGVGGYCLTKDPLLASWSKQHIIGSNEGLAMSENSVKVNDQMPLATFKHFKKHYTQDLNGKKVLLLGVSYLNDVGDTRYTPVQLLYNLLTTSGAVVSLHDPYVSYWEEEGQEVEADINALLNTNQYDIIMVTTGHTLYRNNKDVLSHLKENHSFLYDSIGVFSEDYIKEVINSNHKIKILGRGDI